MDALETPKNKHSSSRFATAQHLSRQLRHYSRDTQACYPTSRTNTRHPSHLPQLLQNAFSQIKQQQTLTHLRNNYVSSCNPHRPFMILIRLDFTQPLHPPLLVPAPRRHSSQTLDSMPSTLLHLLHLQANSYRVPRNGQTSLPRFPHLPLHSNYPLRPPSNSLPNPHQTRLPPNQNLSYSISNVALSSTLAEKQRKRFLGLNLQDSIPSKELSLSSSQNPPRTHHAFIARQESSKTRRRKREGK